MLPAAITAQYLSRTGKYKLLHTGGMLLMTVGMGSFVALDATSGTAMWVCLQLIASLDNVIIATSLLPAVQAGLTDEDNAASAAACAFVGSYGGLLPFLPFFEVNIPLRATLRTEFGIKEAEKLGDKETQGESQ